MKLFSLVVLLGTSGVISAQSFIEAISGVSQLSDLRDLLNANPSAARSLLTNSTPGDQRTILAPNNNAFENYRRTTGGSFASLSSPDLEDTLNYHNLQGALSSADLQNRGGLLSNTALTSSKHDNRGLESNGAKMKPQVVAIAPENTANGRKIKVRKAHNVDVRSGNGQEITLDPTPGNWSGGNFYIVDGFLTLPINPTDTMTAQGLTSFVEGLNRTNVTEGANAASHLTCLCPINEAFSNISQSTGNLTSGPASLYATLTRHALNDTYYSINFTDGALIYSQNGYPILVTRRNDSIFLNDAELVGTDFITNSGTVHALDRIIGFLNTTTNVTTPANADLYRNQSNIPLPSPESSSTSEYPTATSKPPTANHTQESTAGQWKPEHLYLLLGIFVVEAWNYLILK